MRNTPTLGTIAKASDKSKWHINAELGYPLESFCGERFVLAQHQGVADWVAQDLSKVNLCDKCRKGWARRNEVVTELNSMFNLPDVSLRAAKKDDGFDSWLLEEQADHMASI